jgi:ATP-dependent Clp protease ATP-binding subunit ClpC
LDLQKSLEELCLQKEEAIRRDDFDKASSLRDQEVLLRYNFESLMRKEKDQLQDFDPILTTVEINQVISTWTGVPLTRINTSEAERLLQMESVLQERVIGQEEAVVAVAKSIRRARAGLKDSKRPIACLMFAGSTGVGKTELVKALAEYFYGGEDSMVRFDMSEYMMRYTVAKLIGAPPGYLGFQDGGRLTEAVRVKPYSLVLFDEVEKAHVDVLNIMLQVFDDGRLTDSRGRVIMFDNTLIVLTSNVGAWEIQMSYGITKRDPYSRDRFGETNDRDRQERYKQVKEDVRVAMEKKFRPEFINRLDEIIVFKPLSRSQLEKICEVLIRGLAERLKEQGLLLEVTAPVREKLSIMGDDPAYGARPLRRAVVNTVENLLASVLLTRPKDVDTLETAIIFLNEAGDFDLKLKT